MQYLIGFWNVAGLFMLTRHGFGLIGGEWAAYPVTVAVVLFWLGV